MRVDGVRIEKTLRGWDGDGELQFHPTYFTPCQSVFYPICTLMVFDVELSNLP